MSAPSIDLQVGGESGKAWGPPGCAHEFGAANHCEGNTKYSRSDKQLQYEPGQRPSQQSIQQTTSALSVRLAGESGRRSIQQAAGSEPGASLNS